MCLVKTAARCWRQSYGKTEPKQRLKQGAETHHNCRVWLLCIAARKPHSFIVIWSIVDIKYWWVKGYVWGRHPVSVGPHKNSSKNSVAVSGSYLLGAGLLQQHAQAAGILLVVGDQLSQRRKGHLIWHKVCADGGALDPEVEHFSLTASWQVERRGVEVTCLNTESHPNTSWINRVTLINQVLNPICLFHY